MYFRGILILLILSSCSATHHLNKAIKKGYTIEEVTKTVPLTYTLTINGKDSIIERLVDVECPQPTIKARWKVRFDNKRFNDSLKVIRLIYKDSLRHALRTAKNDNRTERVVVRQENKRSRWLLFLIIGLVLGFCTRFIKLF